MVDDRRQRRPAPRQIRRRKLALEDRVLQMVPIPAHSLKDLTQSLVVADGVADRIGSSHVYRVALEGLKLRYFPSVNRVARYTCATPGRAPASPTARSDATVANSSASVQIGHSTWVSPSISRKAVVRILRDCGAVGNSGRASMARRLAPRIVLIGSPEGSTARNA